MIKKKMSLTLSLLAILLLISTTVGALNSNMNAQIERTDDAVNDGYEEREPIHIEGNEDFANQSEENDWPGDGTEEDPYIIEKNRIEGGEDENILIEEVDVHFVIRENILKGGRYGVHLILTSNGSIKDNIVEGAEMGIFLRASDYNIVENNVVTSNGDYGIRPSGSFNNTVRGNILKENSIGIAVINSANHTFERNTAYNNEISGISFHRCYNNYLFDNRLSGHERGIELYASVNHVMKNNTIFENDIGFNIAVEPGPTTSGDNLIYNNNFIENDKQAINRGDNYFFNETESKGNYWSDYEEKYPDAEKENGYWDTPYEDDEEDGFVDEYPMIDPSVPYVDIGYPEDGAVIDDRDLTINWTGRYRYEDELEYEVRLDEGEWEYVGGETEYDLTFFWPGEHSFDVRAANEDVTSVEDTVHFTIDVEPYIYVEHFTVEPDEGSKPLVVNITAELENVAEEERDISLYIDDEVARTWTLEAGEKVSVDMTHEFEEAGTYRVELGNKSTEVTVTEPALFELSIDIDGEGDVEIEPEQEKYEDGTEVKLTAVAEKGWKFVEWTGDHGGPEEEITVTMDDNKSLTAHFEEEVEYYNLTVEVEGEGKVEFTPDREEYEEGTEVTLTALPAEGWEFIEWTGTEKTGEEITVTMDENKSLTAHFEEEVEYYELTIEVEGGGEVEITPDHERYEAGTQVNLTVEPDDGWEFVGWTGDHESEEEEITITMSEDKEITAEFERKDLPGFTFVLLIVGVLIAVLIYFRGKKSST